MSVVRRWVATGHVPTTFVDGGWRTWVLEAWVESRRVEPRPRT